MATTVGPTVSELLRNSRFEILPLDGIEDQVREHLPTDGVVGVEADRLRLDVASFVVEDGQPGAEQV